MCAFRGKHGFGLTKSLMRRAHRGGFVPQSPTKPSPLRCTDPAVQVMRSWCVRKVFLADTKYFRDRFILLGCQPPARVRTECWFRTQRQN